MKRLIFFIFSLITLASMHTVEAKNHVFAGSIGPYKIHMVLNDQFQGYYYYDKNPKGHFKLVLSRESRCDEAEHAPNQWCAQITLQEYSPSRKNSAQFFGTYLSKYEFGDILSEFIGVFVNKTNGKRYSFEVYCAEEVK